MEYNEAVAYLSNLHAFGWRLDLSRMEALCARLGHPERAFRAVHVAGTNGKGSTTAMVAAILARSGFRTGSYFSPYVFNLRERVMVAEPFLPPAMIPEADFARLMTELRPHLGAVAADETLGHPTEFEAKTMLAFLHFRERGVEWAVLETGLGGRLDATNVVPSPEACVITNIGLDHTERLGSTLEAIAGEKAGIIKPGAAVVTSAEEPALSVIREAWQRRSGAEWGRVCAASDRFLAEITRGAATETVVLTPDPERPLYQRANAALASATAIILSGRESRISPAAIVEGIAAAALPGRFQVLRENPTVILDGAHNAEGAAALAASLRERYPRRAIRFIVGMTSRHPVEGVLEALAPLSSGIIATEPDDERHMPAARVAEAAAHHGLHAPVITPPCAALDRALEDAGPEDVIVVTGSFYTVGDISPEAAAPVAKTATDAVHV